MGLLNNNPKETKSVIPIGTVLIVFGCIFSVVMTWTGIRSIVTKQRPLRERTTTDICNPLKLHVSVIRV
ncbi:hypothetical protein NO2_1524, partial [Candidatus Termititenax persephonae]